MSVWSGVRVSKVGKTRHPTSSDKLVLDKSRNVSPQGTTSRQDLVVHHSPVPPLQAPEIMQAPEGHGFRRPRDRGVVHHQVLPACRLQAG